MTKVAKNKTKAPILAVNITLLHTAQRNLIADQKCTILRDTTHTCACTGDCSVVLSAERSWLYEQLKARNQYRNVADLILEANKMVLFVNTEELNEEYQKLLTEYKKHVFENHGQMYAGPCGINN